MDGELSMPMRRCIIYNRGDINGDDEITINDVWSVAEIAMDDNDYSEEQRKAADINRDGSVNLLDVLKAVKKVQQ